MLHRIWFSFFILAFASGLHGIEQPGLHQMRDAMVTFIPSI